MLLESSEIELAGRIYRWEKEVLELEKHDGFSGLRLVTSRPAANVCSVLDEIGTSGFARQLELERRRRYTRHATRGEAVVAEVSPLTPEEEFAWLEFRKKCCMASFVFADNRLSYRQYPYEEFRGLKQEWERETRIWQESLLSDLCGTQVSINPYEGNLRTFIRTIGDWQVFTYARTPKNHRILFLFRRTDDASHPIYIEGGKPYLVYDPLAKYGISTVGWTVQYNKLAESSMKEYERLLRTFWDKAPELVNGLGPSD